MTRTAQNAAIKRATLLAQGAVESLDAEMVDALTALYREQATAISARIHAAGGADDNINLQELRALLDQVDGILRGLSARRNALLDEALGQAAEYGARATLGTVNAAGALVASAASMQVSQEALRFVQTFVAEDGLQLSDRIWRIDRGARDRIVNALESAIIQGHGAGQASREFLSRGAAVPEDVANKINDANAGALSKAAQEIMTGEGSALDNAERLFRTEINRAHGEAFMAGAEDQPDFAGFRFLLSPAHPKPDICDLLSTQNLYGLGPGVYPSREQTPWPAHPNTLSFVEIVFKDEITEADQAGKETPVEALERLTPAQRIGVLGKGKHEVFKEGKLTTGMIRAPLKAVRERIGGRVEVKPSGTGGAKLSAVVSKAYEEARAGGKHGGFLERQSELPDNLIEKGIRSLEKQVARHQAWISDPFLKLDRTTDPQRIKELVEKKWPKDIGKHQTQIEILRGILQARKK